MYQIYQIYNTRYQARYNIHVLALVKGNYYYNIKLKNTNIITCVVTRYQARYNIRALALVKGNYYYNHKTKEYEHHNLWCKRIGF